MSNRQRGAARGAVIQGSFIGGRFRLPATTSPRPQINQHSAHLQRIAQAKLQAMTPRAAQLRSATPQGQVVQRHGNGEAFPLPANLSNFGVGGGQPLPGAVRQKMESFFGTSFADVRIHIGPQASSIGALAFTQGSNLYFAQGQYNPNTPQGQQTLGHELTHVVQQRAGRVSNPFGSGVAVVQDRTLEAEAERMGHRAAAHEVPARTKSVSRVPANRWNKGAASFLVQRSRAIQRKNWQWNGQMWVDAIVNEALDDGAVRVGAQPDRAGFFLNESVYVPDLTQEDIDQADEDARIEQERVQLEAQRILDEFNRLTRLPLRSEAYAWAGNGWVPTGAQYGTKGHEELKKWLAYKFGGERVPSKKAAESEAFLSWAVRPNAWMGFTQNAWPCNNCKNDFISDSLPKQVKLPKEKNMQTAQVNFLFNVIGDSGGYAADHGRRDQRTRGVVVIQGGVVTYRAPAIIPLPPDNF